MTKPTPWPDGKAFAFTILDDTDFATMENVPEVYAILAQLGFRTTRTVWPLEGEGPALAAGATCEDPHYLAWLHALQERGFEIGWHLASYTSSTRGRTVQGLDAFKQMFGRYPRVMSNHAGCVENIYWGDGRLSGMNRLSFNLLTAMRFHGLFQGDLEGSDYFWGDICRERIDYVANFEVDDINTLKTAPMPYHDPHRPFVNAWFAVTDAPEKHSFLECVSEENQERLEAEGGACILHTHFACGFYKDEQVDVRFRELMERLSRKNGWFVPVSTLLDHLREVNGLHTLTAPERNALEKAWVKHKMKVGRS